MRCFHCEKEIGSEEYKCQVCKCSNLCYECFLEEYVIFNAPPVKIVRYCHICEKKFTSDEQKYLLLFTMDYWSSENYFF